MNLIQTKLVTSFFHQFKFNQWSLLFKNKFLNNLLANSNIQKKSKIKSKNLNCLWGNQVSSDSSQSVAFTLTKEKTWQVSFFLWSSIQVKSSNFSYFTFCKKTVLIWCGYFKNTNIMLIINNSFHQFVSNKAKQTSPVSRRIAKSGTFNKLLYSN